MGQAQITFGEDRYFYLTYISDGHFDPEIVKGWEYVSPLHYRTSSLKDAAAFRACADDVAERVFERAFVKRYELPRLPHLSFLDPHQEEGICWILSRSRSYLAHAPGAGKTAQAIVAGTILIRRSGRQCVFIVPPELVINWEREIWKFTHSLLGFPTIGIVGTTARKKSVAWRAQFLIVPDSMLTKSWVYERLLKAKTDLLAVDEASRFKESTSGRSKAFYGGRIGSREFPGLFQNARHVVMLDGSPMPNRPMELWAPTIALDPEAIDCMSQRDFGFRYCGAKQNERGQWEFKHSSHEKELRERLQKRFMHFVGEEELKHPERRRSLLFMNQDVRTAEMRAWEKRNLKLLSTKEFSEDLSQGEVASHRRELGIKKVPWVARYVLTRLENKENEKILLFAWHREVCIGLATIIGKRIGRENVGLVMGGTDPKVRELHFARFQAGSLPVIVGNIAAMGRGHNLQRADRIVFGEFSWSAESNVQCEKRASRRGRDEDAFVRCEYVAAPDSLDERVLKSIFSKERRVKAIIG